MGKRRRWQVIRERGDEGEVRRKRGEVCRYKLIYIMK